MRVGFIGVGGVAQVPLRSLEAIDGAAIRSGIRCDCADATKTLELTLAVNQSIESGQAVSLAG